MDLQTCDGLPKYEILDLRQPYTPIPEDGTLMAHYYASDGSPCIKMALELSACPLPWDNGSGDWLACLPPQSPPAPPSVITPQLLTFLHVGKASCTQTTACAPHA